ncbi:hypothetical protein [Streptomyces sp. NPDC005498]|uniref:hypothetical protein n=1 Tax=Streptomyces sp. NPDC005498 TaxID=3364717 RepID=UPI0036C85E66
MADGHRTLTAGPSARPGGVSAPEAAPSSAAAHGFAPMAARRAGHAWLVHPGRALDQRSWMYAAGLARDPELSLVVVDVPPDPAPGFLADVACVLPDTATGLRLVFGRTPPGGAAQAAHWLAAHTGRVVVTALGHPRPTAQGGLFVGAEEGAGWMRFTPDGGSSAQGRRFPRPEWEHELGESPWSVRGGAVAEPVPVGLWLRPAQVTASLAAQHRTFVRNALRGATDTLTVVVGLPGAAAVPLADVAAVWSALPGHLRPAVRFACLGPVTLPGRMPLGEALAAETGAAVRSYTGLPVCSAPDGTGDKPVILVRPDGGTGRSLMTRETVHFPPPGRRCAGRHAGHRPLLAARTASPDPARRPSGRPGHCRRGRPRRTVGTGRRGAGRRAAPFRSRGRAARGHHVRHRPHEHAGRPPPRRRGVGTAGAGRAPGARGGQGCRSVTGPADRARAGTGRRGCAGAVVRTWPGTAGAVRSGCADAMPFRPSSILVVNSGAG